MGEMQDDAWRGRINALTYGVALDRAVPDEVVSRVARQLIEQHIYTDPVEVYYQAAQSALASPGELGDSTEADRNVRSYLARLVDELYARQPWPEPAFRVLPGEGTAALAAMRPIGRITAGRLLVQQRSGIFLAALSPAAEEFGAVLRMRSGATVALHAARARAASGVAVLSDTDDPDAVRAEFERATGLEVTP